MDSLPPGAIPIDQFQAAEATPTNVASTHPDAPPPGAIPIESFQSQEDKYGTLGQQIKTGAEGLAEGIAGPLAPLAERAIGIKPEDIRAREEENPWVKGGTKALGLTAGMLTGTGEAAVMAKAGEGAAALAGLSHAAEGASLGYRVGSEAVKQAAEMAVLQSGDEVSKMILKDPESSTESAIANVGLAAALGGGTGAAFAGIVSPLWKASFGSKADEFLNGLKNHLSGDSKVELPEAVEQAFMNIGHEPSDLMRSALSGDPKATILFQDLYRAEHPEVMAELKALPDTLKQSVADGLGVNLEDAQVFSNAASGDAIRNKTVDTIIHDYGPIAEEQQRKNAANSIIQRPDELKIKLNDKIYERAMSENVGLHSEAFKIYEKVAQEAASKDTIGGIDAITSRLGKQIRFHGTDPVAKDALVELRQLLNEHKEAVILGQAKSISPEAAELGSQLIHENKLADKNYRQYVEKFQPLMDHLGIGDWHGTESLKTRLGDLTAEQIIKKFSTKGDAKAQQFLVENFPEISHMVRDHEAKAFLAPSVHDVAGETSLDIKSLSRRLENLKKGSPEHADWVLSKDAQKRIESAKVINDALSQAKAVKNSGTPAGMSVLYRHMGGSALAAVGMLAGHNPITGYVLGEAAQRVGKELPEAMKLGMLKFIGSDQPVKAEGFKAMVNFVHNTIKGENALAKSTKAVFQKSAQVLTESQMPFKKDKEKIDKAVSDSIDKPEKMMHMADASHLGHYMPEQQSALTAAQTRAIQYLQTIKPHDKQLSPLDKPIPPSKAEEARYNRALDIAASPAIVLKHVHDGTLLPSDVTDLRSMYPALYQNMATKLSNEMTKVQSDEGQTAYHTRMALSIFLGQPLDSTMTPTSIMAAQPMPKAPPPPPQGQKAKGGAKTANTMMKNANQYKTQGQAAEADRNGRD